VSYCSALGLGDAIAEFDRVLERHPLLAARQEAIMLDLIALESEIAWPAEPRTVH
jgi:hypothetical protein